MVIQRIQSIYLLLACLASAAVGLFVPLASFGDGSANALQMGHWATPILVICVITAVLQLVDIFLFSNLKLQMKVALMSTIMVCASAFVWAFMMLFRLEESITACWVLPAVCFVASLVLTLLARSSMNKDYKKLKSYDRLW